MNWEYKIISEPQNLSWLALQKHLEEAGAEGWELTAILGLLFIFKRPKPALLT